MVDPYTKTSICAVLTAVGLSACAADNRARDTSEQVVGFAVRLDQQLQDFDKSLSETRTRRERRINELELKQKSNERYIEERTRVWTVASNAVALKLYNAVRSTRNPSQVAPVLLEFDKDGSTKRSSAQRLYDPKPLRTVVEKLQKLTARDSDEEFVTRLISFVKTVREKAEKNQTAAEEQLESAQVADETNVSEQKNRVDSSAATTSNTP
jgi:type VI protein secretion system component VasF